MAMGTVAKARKPRLLVQVEDLKDVRKVILWESPG